MSRILFVFIIILVMLNNQNTLAVKHNEVDVEEGRIEKAMLSIPNVFDTLSSEVASFKAELKNISTSSELNKLVQSHSHKLWRAAVATVQIQKDWDDRALYWSRLQLRKALKLSSVFMKLAPTEQALLLNNLELVSRGQQDSRFSDKADIRILVTGFDPFFLDRNINQSNPSGVAAMWLDGMSFRIDDKLVSIEAYIVPVRFADFDEGLIETLLTPHIAEVDMIATISMGRTEFDLERFPGRRRSAEAPDNLNVLTGANSKKPLIPLLNAKPLNGPEFVEFSLPVKVMQKATGEFKIIDNHKVRTLNGEMTPDSLQALENEIAVSGAGGGYLSNEISYRSILIRNALRPELPVGHIHTPRIKAFEPETSAKIVAQIEAMLKYAAASLADNN